MIRSSRPHVIIIMADQLRYDALGEHTPHINGLLSESIRFNSAYCASPLCVPGRGAFFTGKYPNVTGSLHNAKIQQEKQYGKVREGHINLYDLMENDWDSWHTGKMDFRTEDQIHLRPNTKTHWFPLEPRYKQFLREHGKRIPGGELFRGLVPELTYGKTTRIQRISSPTVGCYEEGFEFFYDGFILNDTLHALKNRDQDQPMLLNAMFFAPHPPFDIPEPWFSRVKEVNLPDNVAKWGRNQSPLQLYNLTGVMGSALNRDQWQEVWKVYMGFVSLLDCCVGEVIAELKRQNMYDDALIIFTSDHGEMLGSHRLWQKNCMYEESVRTPLAFKFPKGEDLLLREIDEVVSSVDILPTLCDYLGLDAPAGFSGTSLMPLCHGESIDRESIYIQYDGNGSSSNFSRSVVSRGSKLIVDFFKDEIFIEYYDLTHDPQEMNNLAFEPEIRKVVEQKLQLLRTHMQETGDRLSLPTQVYEHFIATYSEFKDREMTN